MITNYKKNLLLNNIINNNNLHSVKHIINSYLRPKLPINLKKQIHTFKNPKQLKINLINKVLRLVKTLNLLSMQYRYVIKAVNKNPYNYTDLMYLNNALVYKIEHIHYVLKNICIRHNFELDCDGDFRCYLSTTTWNIYNADGIALYNP